MSSVVESWLIAAGVLLLGASALLGFMQAREASGSAAHTRWRVAHNGGTAGGVQLIALGSVITRLHPGVSDAVAACILAGVAFGTWAFFVGPLLRALGAESPARTVNLIGACVAGPAYLALPVLVLT